jgi:hypothetical protein
MLIGLPVPGNILGLVLHKEVHSLVFLWCCLLSQNMLHSLSGTWRLEPLKIHHTASCFNSSSSSRRLPAAAGKQPLSPYSLSFLASSSSSTGDCSSGLGLPAGLCIDADGNVTATLVQYEQYAQPKGEQCTVTASLQH